jgi:hypothetical protein
MPETISSPSLGPDQPKHEDRRHSIRRGIAIRLLLGAGILAGGLLALERDVEAWNVAWYVTAWYGYLILLDALLLERRGVSYLTHRRRELVAMMLWSIPFWLFHEAYNLRLENWYYVFTLHGLVPAAAFTALAFATVLPACLLHAEALAALRAARGRERGTDAVRPGLRALWAALGIASLLAPLLWPRWAFPLVWGALLWLPDLWAARAGAPSLLGDLERGSAERIGRLLAGGLWAGALWELFNYPARCKWIYTVPGFERAKLGEMPILGFLGFPVLALAAFSFYSALCHALRGGRRWELDSAPAPPRDPSRARARAVAAAAAALAIAVYAAVRAQPDHSLRPLLVELDGLAAGDVARLRAAGIPTPERLERAVAGVGLEGVASRAGITTIAALERAARHAALAVHKGMGTERARLLMAAGVESVAELARADPETLHPRLAELARRAGGPVPRLAEVRLWIGAASPDGRPRR